MYDFFLLPLQEERDRQIAMMKERVSRVRYERTITMKAKGALSAKKFDDLVNEKETSNMSEDDKMSLAAHRMQKKFQEEEEGVKLGIKSVRFQWITLVVHISL